MRRTKIVATLGPATSSLESLEALVEAGVDVVRLNFSHGTHEQHRETARLAQLAASNQGRLIAILGDLQGPKIRTSRFVKGKITLELNDPFILDTEWPANEGNQERVGVTYKKLTSDLSKDDVLLLDDGRVVLKVIDIQGSEINTIVLNGGVLSDNKGINRRGGGLTAASLTEKDREDIKFAADIDVDYLAISFPRSADDVHLARKLMKEAGGEAGIVAKIERAEALDNIDSIIEASEVIMIARGDLGVEIGDAELPAVQKELANKAREMNRVVITATQMMESMIENPIPTRAEVFDVANAVMDGTDAVMLSGETAVGAYPAKVVTAMGNICEAAEKQQKVIKSKHRINTHFDRVDEAIAMASMYTANHLDVKAIAALTESGSTTLWMSRISSGIPIYAMTQHQKSLRLVKLYRGVYPVKFPVRATSHAEANQTAVGLLKERDVVTDGDQVIITKGDLMGTKGGTNAMKIVVVGNLPDVL